MLMQLLIGNEVISDDEIIEDYYRSNVETTRIVPKTPARCRDGVPSAAAAAMVVNTVGTGSNNDNHSDSDNKRIKMDKNVFGGTNRPAMISTLEGLRCRHSHIDDVRDSSSRFERLFDRTIPRYFDLIGFDELWRKRFRKAFRATTASLIDDNEDEKDPIQSRL